MTTRQSDVASDFLYIAPPPIYGFVIEKEFPATLFFFFLPPPLTAGDRRLSLCQVDPFAVISIRGKRRSGLRTGSSIQRAPSSSLLFSSRMPVRGVGDVITRRTIFCSRTRAFHDERGACISVGRREKESV